MGSPFKGRKIITLNFCQCQSARLGRYLVSKIRITAQLHKPVFLHKHTLFYPVKLPQQPNTLLANAGRFRRELCLPSTRAPLSDLGSSTQHHPLHMNDAFYLQFVSLTLKTWMNFYCILQPGARIFPEPFKSPYQQPTSNTQTKHLHTCADAGLWCLQADSATAKKIELMVI